MQCGFIASRDYEITSSITPILIPFHCSEILSGFNRVKITSLFRLMIEYYGLLRFVNVLKFEESLKSLLNFVFFFKWGHEIVDRSE